jgi:Ca2+-binding EF-hand superfamily protein
MSDQEDQHTQVRDFLLAIAESEMIKVHDNQADAALNHEGEIPDFEVITGCITNKDAIDENDLADYFDSMGMSDAQVVAKSLVSALDVDGDGQIGKSDWETYLRSKETKGQPRKTPRKDSNPNQERPRNTGSNQRERPTDTGTEEKFRHTMASTADKSMYNTNSKYAPTEQRNTANMQSEITQEKYKYQEGGYPVEKDVVTKITRGQPSQRQTESRLLTSDSHQERPTQESRPRDTTSSGDEVNIQEFKQAQNQDRKSRNGTDVTFQPRSNRNRRGDQQNENEEETQELRKNNQQRMSSRTGRALERSREGTRSVNRRSTTRTTTRTTKTASFGRRETIGVEPSVERLVRQIISSIEDFREVEHRRADLAIQSNVDITLLFDQASSSSRPRLSTSDLNEYLRNIGISASFSEVRDLVYAFDRDDDGLLDISEFTSIFLPSDAKYRSELLDRLSTAVTGRISYDTEILVSAVFRSVLDAEINFNVYKEELKGRLHELFELIGTKYNFRPTTYDFKELFSTQGFYASVDEIDYIREKLDLASRPVTEVTTIETTSPVTRQRSTSIRARRGSYSSRTVDTTTTTSYVSEPRIRPYIGSARHELITFREEPREETKTYYTTYESPRVDTVTYTTYDSPQIDTTTYYTCNPEPTCCSSCYCRCASPCYHADTITIERSSPAPRRTTTEYVTDTYTRRYEEPVIETEIIETSYDRYPWTAKRHRFGSKMHACGYLKD